MKIGYFLLLGVILAGILAAAILLPKRQTAPGQIPRPNGFDYYSNAANVLNTRESSGLTNVDAMRRHLAANQETLRQLRLGLGFRCVVPPEHNINFPPADLPLLKSLSILLRSEGDLALAEDRPRDAAKAYLDGIRFGQEVSRGVLIYDMVGISLEFNASAALAKCKEKLSSTERQYVIDQLSILRTNREPFSAVSEREKMLMRLSRTSALQAVMWPLLWYRMRPALQKDEDKGLQNIARIELLRTDFALQNFHGTNNRWPAIFSELKLNPPPMDPFSPNNALLLYSLNGAGYRLYSFGPDRKDDGGDLRKDITLESKFLGRSNQ